MAWTCRLFNTLISVVIFSCITNAQIPSNFKIGKPIPLGHSHNDYIQMRPLWEALENGFTSLEVDIFTAADNQLHVSHIPFALIQKPTLEKLYLKPLKEWLDLNNGHVFPMDTGVTLTVMIDLKGNGHVTYPILKTVLEPYKEYLTLYKQGKLVKKGPLRIMLSGGKPMELITQDIEQMVCVDGSIGGDYTNSRVHIGRESAPFSAFFQKRANGSLNAKEAENLNRVVTKSKEHKREIRFWAAGNNVKRWQMLKDAGVTVINADKLKTFRKWVTGE